MGNSLGEGLFLEIRQPRVEVAGVTAGRGFGWPNVDRSKCERS